MMQKLKNIAALFVALVLAGGTGLAAERSAIEPITGQE